METEHDGDDPNTNGDRLCGAPARIRGLHRFHTGAISAVTTGCVPSTRGSATHGRFGSGGCDTLRNGL